MNNCGGCNSWNVADKQQSREACQDAICTNEQSPNFKKITIHGDGCQVWKPLDAGQQRQLT